MKLRNDFLEIEITACELMLSNYKVIKNAQEKVIANKDQQIALLQNNVQNYQDLYNSEKELQPDFWDKLLNTLKDIGIYSAVFAVGWVVGTL